MRIINPGDFIGNRFSIVSDKKDIDNKWIDRDTHQKTFRVLSQFASPAIDPWVDLQGDRSSSRLRDKEPSLKAIVSGFYYEKEDAFIVSKTRIYKTKLKTPSFDFKTENPKLSFIKFQLRENGRVLEEIKRPAFKNEKGVFAGQWRLKGSPFSFFPCYGGFSSP